MKGIRYLLLLLLAIISQGAWAEGEPELTTGVIGVTCPSHEGYFGNDEIVQSSANYSALYHFVPSKSGTLLIKDISSAPATTVVAIFNSDRSFVLWSYGSYFKSDVVAGTDYYIGFAPMYEYDSLDNEQFLVGLYCEQCMYGSAQFTTVERQEATCTTRGMEEYNICENCGAICDQYGNTSDLALLALPYAPHKFHAGECQNCDYVAQTITLAKNGDDYTFDGNVNYDLNSSVGENSNVSVFHLHTPEHGIVNVSAHVSKNESRFDAYPPYLYFYQEGHVESQGYSTNMGYEPTLRCEDNLIANTDYYLVVKNAETINARLEVILHPHETNCIQERVNPTCTESGVKALYGCSTCDYYFTDEGDVVYSTDAQYRTIPALGHNLNENGVCTRCGEDLHISEGTHTIVIPACQSTGETIADYSYLAYFNAPRTGRLNIGLNDNSSRRKAIAVFKKNSNDEWQLLESRYNGYVYALNYDVTESDEFIIGVRPYLNNSEIQNVSLSVKVLCQEHKWQYFEEQEATCTEAGHDGYRYCAICNTYYSYYSDVETVPSVYGRIDHKFVNGICIECHYEVPTIELVKNEETGKYYYYNDNFNFDLKSSCWGEDYSIFRVFVPEHGGLNILAYAYFDDPSYAFAVLPAYAFEYSEPSYGGAMSAPKKSNAAPIDNYAGVQAPVPGGGYIYVLVNNNEAVESSLNVSLIPHDVECVQPHVDPSCEDGTKAVYHCLFCSNYYYTEDGILNPQPEDFIIPGNGHQEDIDGTCTVCGQKVRLTDGENHVQFASGENVITAFKYTATQTNCLNVVVDTNATIDDYTIMPWSQWRPSNNDTPMSAPRKIGENDDVEPLMMRVIAGQEYAILFDTTAENDEDATITLSYTEIIYPELAEGDNNIDIASNDVGLYGDAVYNPDTYELYKFVATKTGTLNVSSDLEVDVLSAIFDADFNFLNIQAPSYGYSVDVERNKTYYIGLRTINGSAYDNYNLNLEIEGLPEFEGTLVLDDSKSLEDNLGEWKDIEMFTATEGVSYMRSATSSKWGTVVLPYELQSNENVAYYDLTAADILSGSLEFSKVETVAPNTPTVFRILSGNQYDASVNGPVTIERPNDLGDFRLYTWYDLGDENVDWYLDGWYYEDVINTQDEEGYCKQYGAGIMYISGDKFWHATGTVTVKPYRAIFEVYGVDWSAASAKAMTISFKDEDGDVSTIESIMEENGEFTDVEAVYSIDGQRMNSLQRGVNIIRTADGKTRKFIKK